MILATWWDLLGEDYNRFSFVASVGVSIIAVLVSVLILRRYLERKTRIAGLLAGFLITLTFSVILDPIFLLIRAVNCSRSRRDPIFVFFRIDRDCEYLLSVFLETILLR